MNKYLLAVGILLIGLFLLVIGIYIGETDDSPGAGGLGIILMLCSFWLSWRVLRKAQK